MENQPENRLCSRLISIASATAFFAIGVGVLVLGGWWARIEVIKRIFTDMIAMNPVSAICLIGAGLSLALQIRGKAGISRWLALLVLAVGSLKLGGYLTGWVFPVDRWFFTSQLSLNEPVAVNRIAPNTSLAFVLLGLALLLPEKRIRQIEMCATGVLLVALLALLGYIYQVGWLYGLPAHVPMALHTAATLLVLGTGVLLARPDLGWMAVVAGDSPGGMLARRMLPAMVLVYILAGGLKLLGERKGYYSPELGVALFTVSSIAIFGVVVLWSARSLHQIDLERKRANAGILQLNAELRQQAARLESVNEELESFSYSVSHDLRAPLRGISGFALALEEHSADALDDMSRGYLRRVRNAAKHMGDLIDDLLKLSRLTRAEMKMQPVNLSELASSLVAEYRQADPAREVEVVIAPNIPVNGDPALLRVLLDNLLGNAWKFTSKNPAARIEVGCGPGYAGKLACFVRDNGVGFDNRYAHKLFGAFQRLHSQAEFPGTGIGLATVQRIVHRHGGQVSAQGVIGGGATFGFTLEASGKGENP